MPTKITPPLKRKRAKGLCQYSGFKYKATNPSRLYFFSASRCEHIVPEDNLLASEHA